MRAHALKPSAPAKRPRGPWQAQTLPHGVRAKLKLGGAQDEAETGGPRRRTSAEKSRADRWGNRWDQRGCAWPRGGAPRSCPGGGWRSLASAG